MRIYQLYYTNVFPPLQGEGQGGVVSLEGQGGVIGIHCQGSIPDMSPREVNFTPGETPTLKKIKNIFVFYNCILFN